MVKEILIGLAFVFGLGLLSYTIYLITYFKVKKVALKLLEDKLVCKSNEYLKFITNYKTVHKITDFNGVYVFYLPNTNEYYANVSAAVFKAVDRHVRGKVRTGVVNSVQDFPEDYEIWMIKADKKDADNLLFYLKWKLKAKSTINKKDQGIYIQHASEEKKLYS